MNDIRKILVPTDLSAKSLGALEYGITLAKLYGSKLYVLHIMDDRPYEDLSRACSLMDELFSSLEKNVMLELSRYAGETISGEIEEVLHLVRCGIPEEEIVTFAESEKIELIVMTDKAIIYESDKVSIAGKIMRMTNIPVITLKPGIYGEKKTNLNFIERDYLRDRIGDNYYDTVHQRFNH